MLADALFVLHLGQSWCGVFGVVHWHRQVARNSRCFTMVLDASATANYKNKKVKTIVVNTNNIILFEFPCFFKSLSLVFKDLS